MNPTAADPAEEFARLADPYRRELLAHCYRMLGSVHDAEDLVQETYLRAWRAYGRFEGRSSLRTWLYRIATTACLRALENRARRPLPSGLAGPGDPDQPLAAALDDLAWLQPFPDALLGTNPADPAEVVESREDIRLAFVAALQNLRASQRAVLLLRDVLKWRAAEVAELLGTTTVAVNSTLQRARAQLAAVNVRDSGAVVDDPTRRALLENFVKAFENADVDLLARLLRDDAVLEMPPIPTWFGGADAVVRFLGSRVLTTPSALRLVPAPANGQPAFALYQRGDDGEYRAHAIHVLTIAGARIARMSVFLDASMFPAFGLPPALA